MALNSLFCADVPLSNYSLTQLSKMVKSCILWYKMIHLQHILS